MRAVKHTIRGGLCTHHAAWVNHTENRCIAPALRAYLRRGHETSSRDYQSLMYVGYAPPTLYIRTPAV